MSILSAFALVGLGMFIAHVYNWLAWRKYYEGRKDSGEWRSRK